MMPHICFWLFCILSWFGLPAIKRQEPTTTIWMLEKGTMDIKGMSNINSFCCSNTQFYPSDTLLITSSPDSIYKIKGTIEMKVQAFNCSNTIITSDFRKTLQSTLYPKIKISFSTIERYNCQNPNWLHEKVNGIGTITIAGVVKQMHIPLQCCKISPTTLSLSGNNQIIFSEYHLKTPKHLWGLVKLKDTLHLNFSLAYKMTERI